MLLIEIGGFVDHTTLNKITKNLVVFQKIIVDGLFFVCENGFEPLKLTVIHLVLYSTKIEQVENKTANGNCFKHEALIL